MRLHGTTHALIASSIAALSLTGCGADVPPPTQTDATTIEQQAQEFIEALKPRSSDKPVIAILALNEGTEITDFLLTHAVLQRSGVADVQAVAPRSGRVLLYPALQIDGAQDFASFEKAHPSGPDYVIVPAMHDPSDPEIAAWLKQQAARGARIVSVCAGALVVGNAGLLDGRRFTTHWFYRDDVLEEHPNAVYVPHQRYVVDRDVASTTGITASVPTMLALVEAIGGREKAQALADDLGVSSWSPAHDSSLFGLNFKRGWHYVLNKMAFWGHENWSIDAVDGIDDISLAFAADSWSRTGRINVEASAPNPVKLRSGLTLVTEPADRDTPRMPLTPTLKPVQQLDRTLCEIGERFGDARREWVMIELEYADANACSAG